MTFPKVLMTKKIDGVNDRPFEISLVRRKAGWDGWTNAPEAFFVRTNDLHPTDPQWFHKVFYNMHDALDAYCQID